MVRGQEEEYHPTVTLELLVRPSEWSLVRRLLQLLFSPFLLVLLPVHEAVVLLCKPGIFFFDVFAFLLPLLLDFLGFLLGCLLLLYFLLVEFVLVLQHLEDEQVPHPVALWTRHRRCLLGQLFVLEIGLEW